jgi:2-polyprenyl-3-methyl-5-hydroxy-6-metoxy-1,4-benzoquinol methylase
MMNSNKKKKQIEFEDEKLKGLKVDVLTFKNEDFDSLSLIKNKDLVPGEYEGGVKLWECSLDLCNFLPGYVGWYDLTGLKVLDLGCGHGLPGLYFLLRGAKVMFQDFNQEVLDKITKVYINQIYKKYNRDFSNNAAFLSGDWKDFNSKIEARDFECKSEETAQILSQNKFDIIISADTIYNLNNYDSFYSVIKEKMNNPGICFICSKKFYFGVGGGTSQFIDYVSTKGEFEVKVVKEFNDGMSTIRQIIELKHQK